MIKNKLDHLIMGFLIMFGGLLIAFLAPRFLPELMKPPCLVVGTAIACLGCFQAVVVGHAPFYILALVFAPFMIVWEIFAMPVKKKGRDVSSRDRPGGYHPARRLVCPGSRPSLRQPPRCIDAATPLPSG